MSELFKRLSKTEGKRASNPPAQVFDIGIQAEPLDESVIPTETEHIKTIIPSQAEFDLHLANSKITAILDSGTVPGEQFRFLRARLSLLQRQQGLKRLLITSTLPGEGKTFVSCCLAGILAQEPGKRVLLIDGDMRMPRTAKELGLGKVNELAGLSQILQGTNKLKESLLKLSGTELFYLPSGEIPQNPSELLATGNLDRVIHESVELFDWIIIDSPPVLNVADSSHLSPLCDAVLMVIQANKTPIRLIQKAIETLGRNHICGVLMNKAQMHRSSRYYYKYYYSKTRQASK